MENTLIIAWIITALGTIKTFFSFVYALFHRRGKSEFASLTGLFALLATVTGLLVYSWQDDAFINNIQNEINIPVIQNSYTSWIYNNTEVKAELESIPEYSDYAYCIINDNKPFFSSDEITNESFESYGELDELSRCTECIASIGKDLMPTEERGKIGSIKPTGWNYAKYDFVDGKYLYNRCHLIGFQLTGENANEKNLITGTRYLNVKGMLPFENMVADYVRETDNHVMYRVTPVFEEDNLLASGVLMEAYSVEDEGDGIEFCVYCYNVQPGVTIDYKTGNSELAE